MGNYYETFAPPFLLTRVGPALPDYQRAYAFDDDTQAADERLEADVWKRLSVLAKAVPLQDLKIDVARGFVTLSGSVSNPEAVVRFVDHTVGVRGVTNSLAGR